MREAEALGISKSTAARMFAILEERGFLKIVRNSGFSVKIKMARTWRITAEPTGEERATNDFMRYQNSEHGPMGGTHSPTSGTVTSVLK